MPKQTFFNLSEDKRKHILDCAIEEFAEKGYKLASISRIVSVAGIAKGSFYQYFDNKDDLYIYIFDIFIARRKIAVFEEEKNRLEELTLTQYLRLVFQRQLEQFRSSPLLMKIGLELTQLGNEPVYKKLMKQYTESYNTYFLPFIQHEVNQGEIDPKVNQTLLNFMLVSVGQYLTYRLSSSDFFGIDNRMIDILVDDLEYILTNGIYTEAVKKGGDDIQTAI